MENKRPHGEKKDRGNDRKQEKKEAKTYKETVTKRRIL